MTRLFSVLVFVGLSVGCGHFQGPAPMETPPPLKTPEYKKVDEEPIPKAHIQNDLGKSSAVDTSDDESDDESVLEKLQHEPNPDLKDQDARQMHFAWPVDEARLSRGFINTKRKHHWGLDLANKKGTPILAAESGYVVYTGRGFHGYGRLIVIEHNDRWATLYAHLNKFLVKEGDFVKRGVEVGEMGRTGHATGSHLHFELRDNRLPIDPLSVLPQIQ